MFSLSFVISTDRRHLKWLDHRLGKCRWRSCVKIPLLVTHPNFSGKYHLPNSALKIWGKLCSAVKKARFGVAVTEIQDHKITNESPSP